MLVVVGRLRGTVPAPNQWPKTEDTDLSSSCPAALIIIIIIIITVEEQHRVAASCRRPGLPKKAVRPTHPSPSIVMSSGESIRISYTKWVIYSSISSLKKMRRRATFNFSPF